MVSPTSTGRSRRPSALPRVRSESSLFWLKLVLSVAVIFFLLHGSATRLGSLRGEAGIAVGVLVVLACLIAKRALWGEALSIAVHTLGLGRPAMRSLYVAVAAGAVLLLTLPAFAIATQAHGTMYPGWRWLLPGLFAQGGVAEEVLFRGYLFGTIRQRYSFWRAAMLSAGPFVAAHFLLFATMSWPVALAATALAFVTSFPLAHLFELGGRTIWAPALVHFTMQSTVKVVEMSGSPTAYAMVWLAACAIVPWLVFAVRVPAARVPEPVPAA
jgi:membrane protease YdiL (CAAX protease family)